MDKIAQMVNQEFNRDIPSDIASLVKKSQGGEKTPTGGRTEPFFYQVFDPLATNTVREYQDTDELRPTLGGKDFIDLGCGADFPQEYIMKFSSMAEFAIAMGAARYIGVDINPISETKSENQIFLQDEMLNFLARIPDDHPTGKIFFLSGIESHFNPAKFDRYQEALAQPDPSWQARTYVRENQEIARYHEAFQNELHRITKPGDGIFFGAGRKCSIKDYLTKDAKFSKEGPIWLRR